MLRLGFPVIGVNDVPRAVTFWTAALGLAAAPESQNRRWCTLVRAGDPPEPVLGLMYSETPVQEHPRLHLDLMVDTEAEQRAEAERLVALGARRVDWDSYPPDPDFVVLADPDGNAFCIVDLSRSPAGIP
ncbi:VOC family protein [Actinomadura roseirufa]|uniref:VOC family protein n=1 Tax=Actinomadura roseirufa TaxID=2094049 RepID=UPI001041B968|nr:VOC family protein [Actinomadura roseirufa]